MSKLRKTKNNKLILVLPMVLVICFGVLLTYSFANFKSIKLFDAVGGFFLGNEYTLSYDVANCTNKTIKNGKTFGELCVPAIPDGYTFDGWYYNDELIETTTQVHTNQNIQLLAHFSLSNNCIVGTTYDFDYTGDVQDFTVQCPGQYKVELWGAKGIEDTSANISYGAYTSGQINLAEGQSLYVYVGEVGSDTSSGFNGGGAGRLNDTLGYKWGGGATDVRYFGTTTPSDNDLVWNSNIGLNSRIMVAAGGGGGSTGNASSAASNSNAGGLTGYNGTYNSSYSSYYARGGSQTAGGTVTNYGSSFSAGTAGAFGIGGNGGGGNTASNGIQTGSYGGGGGYYGGGGGSRWSAATTGGAGGSSYISGHAGSIAIAEGATNNPRTIKSGCSSSSTSVDCSKHYSGLYFTNTVMIDGSGYNWTTTKGSLVNQPQPDGTTTTGHNGNGYARITYLGSVTEFAYTGNIQTYIAPLSGTYKLEVWGAQGKDSSGAACVGGLGGYSSGYITLNENDTLYIAVGGAGGNSRYNGGGSAGGKYSSGAGGGATHIATINRGVLSNYNSYRSEVLIVAGGGGGGVCGDNNSSKGGAGGGLSGVTCTRSTSNYPNLPGPGTQSGGGAGGGDSARGGSGSFGQGGTGSASWGGAGGGGWFGGGGGHGLGGAGGSGYVGNLINAKSIAGNESLPTHDGLSMMTGNTGNGYARITYLPSGGPTSLVPVITNNTDKIISSSHDPNDSNPWYVFDNDDSTLWSAVTKTNEYIGYHFDDPVRVTSIKLKPSNTAGYARVKNFRVEASNDNNTWTTLYTGLYDSSTESILKEYEFTNLQKYSYYRVYVLDNYASATNMYIRIDTLEFYGYN